MGGSRWTSQSSRATYSIGGAVATGAGRLSFGSIIPVAGINALGRASEQSIAGPVKNAMGPAKTPDLRPIASHAPATLVRFRPRRAARRV